MLQLRLLAVQVPALALVWIQGVQAKAETKNMLHGSSLAEPITYNSTACMPKTTSNVELQQHIIHALCLLIT